MTADEVLEFRENLRAALPGFVQPNAYGVGLVTDTDVTFPVVNNGGTHDLPAIVLASVLGYRSGSCTLAMTPEQLRAAYKRLAPVEACTFYTHPNLWSWRALLSDHPDGEFVVVFLNDPASAATDEIQRSFLALADNSD